ncbi:40S ribosomal protein S24 (nucleomorph) [Chroomonas mesostigmatica CCMP1168]|uniref:40S ribosomal protein S24 n=1 Tax=Chroomonas mesostigmatica CCMP1168 TaxID=1195612 RepID=J7G5S1_9CRYP|nr:40S ribosomal protein S24 [Chroomonas mesostigmatica CCMP1168]|mmetsp:Transcript_40782/g.100203  ORF Transcript_40782/g.100203 Transcript_40782/m.100203 type:complete len:132 (-) Transcript_40782:262-657(-)
MFMEEIKITTKKFKNNILLNRKQFIIELEHPDSINISKKKIQKMLAKKYKILDPSTIFLFGFKTYFGGKKSVGAGFIYDNLKAARQIEPRYRLLRNNLVEIQRTSAKQRKERKNRAKKIRGKTRFNIKKGK